MEEELIGGGTDDKGRAAPIEKRNCFRIQCQAVHEHRPVVENLHAIEIEDLLRALSIDSFRRVKDERQIGRCVIEVVDQVGIHLQ